ncbi:hypothetical protein NYE67_02725 [Solibacillus sp. FSL W8-0474]|uniref:hypothetical protein n=1 Tax=Solibacillus sp. FSL W8-0474 TaxID=2975336 RepID=UPI0030F8E7DC
MYKYQFTTNCGHILAFKSEYHITSLTPVIFKDATFLRFEDVEYVVKLNDMKDVKINGIKHQLRAYMVR